MDDFRKGWPIILCGLIGVAASSVNITVYTMALLAPELSSSFGWKVSEVQAVHIPATIALVCTLPIVGILTDKFGPRIVGLTSAAILGVGLLLFSLIDTLAQFFLLSIMISVGGAGTLAVTWARMVNFWFTQRRGLALGIMLLGTGVGGSLLKPYTAALISAFGWQGAYIGLGLLPLLLTLPLCFFKFHRPVSVEPGAVSDEQLVEQAQGVTTGQALSDWRFWALGLAMVPTAATIGAMIANMEIMLESMNFGPDQRVAMASFIGVSVIAGRLIGGWSLDRFNAGVVGATMILVMAAGCLLMANPPLSTFAALLVIASVGLCSGVEFDAIAFLVGRLFGLRSYSRIYSGILMFYFMAGATGPFLFSRWKEEFGTYDFVLQMSAGALLVAAGLMLAIGLSRRPAFATAH